ncbi:MAG: hypothetical protein IJ831_04090 [Spirochaetales bacterium]|nr:hypothetical protein [Spirochaetales bacterium]
MKYFRFLGLFIVALLLVVSCEGATDLIVDLMEGTEKNFFVENDLVDLPASATQTYENTTSIVSVSGTGDGATLDALSSDDLESLSNGLSEIINTPTLVAKLNKDATADESTAAKKEIQKAVDYIEDEGLLSNSNIPDDLKETLTTIQSELAEIASGDSTLSVGDVMQVQIISSIMEEVKSMADEDKFNGDMETILKQDDVKKLINYASVVVAANDKLSGKLNVFDKDFIDGIVSSMN